MHLTLFVPDLIWPDRENAAAFDFVQSDVLAHFLSLAEHTQTVLSPTESWETVLAARFNFGGNAPPPGHIASAG